MNRKTMKWIGISAVCLCIVMLFATVTVAQGGNAMQGEAGLSSGIGDTEWLPNGMAGDTRGMDGQNGAMPHTPQEQGSGAEMGGQQRQGADAAGENTATSDNTGAVWGIVIALTAAVAGVIFLCVLFTRKNNTHTRKD